MSWMRRVAGGMAAAVLGTAVLAGCTSSTGGAGTGQPAPPTDSTDRVSLPPASLPASLPPASSASAPSQPATSSSSAAPQQPLDVIDIQNLNGATYRMSLWAQDQLTECASHSYGAVVAYFRAHPCRHASRYLWTMNFHGRALALSIVSVVAAPSSGPDIYKYAAQFTKLENSNGTGSINDLLREGHRIPGVTATSIPSNEVFQVAGQDNGVSVFDAWYVTGSTNSNDNDVKQLEQSLFLTPASEFHY